MAVKLISRLLSAVILFLTVSWSDAVVSSCNVTTLGDVSGNGNTADANSDITWGPLPTGQEYKTDTTYDDGGLGPYFDFARSFINTAMPAELPIGMIEGLNKGTFDVASDYKQIIDFAIGYIVCFALGIVFLVIFTIVGICFCCCRCCGCCGGKRVQKYSPNAGCKKTVFSAILFILIVFISVGMICLYVSNERMTVALQNMGSVFDSSLEDADVFVDNLVAQAKHLSTDNFNFTYKVLQRDLGAIDTLLGVPVRDAISAGGNISDTFNKVTAFTSTFDALAAQLIVLNTTLGYVKGNGTALSTAIANVKTSITVTKTSCGGSCSSLDLASLDTDLDTNNFPDITPQLDKMEAFQQQDMTSLVADAQKQFLDVPCQVKNESQSAVDTIISQVDSFSDSGLNTITDQMSTLTSNVDLSSYKGTGDEFIDTANTYNKYRWYGGIALASIILLIVLLLFIGLAMGICGGDNQALPTERGCASNSGGNFLMAGVAFIFIFTWLLMLFCSLMFAVGAPLEKWICQPVTNFDSELYTDILDKSGGPLGEGYFISGTLFGNNSIPMTISGVMKDCRDGKAAYSALKLENLFNLTKALDYKSTVNIDSQLDTLDSAIDFSTLSIHTPDLTTQLNDAKTAVQVDTAGFNTELGNNLTKIHLPTLATELRTLAASVTDPEKTQFNNHATTLDNIHNIEYQALQNSADELKTEIAVVDTMKSQIPGTVDGLLASLQSAEDFLQNNGSDVVKQEAKNYANRIFKVVDSFIDYTSDALQNDVGKCDVVYNLFTGIVTNGICKYAVDALNGFWFSLGWCIFFFVPSVIFAVKLCKHFRRMTYLDDMDRSFKYGVDRTPLTDMTNMESIKTPPSNQVFPSNKVGHMDGW